MLLNIKNGSSLLKISILSSFIHKNIIIISRIYLYTIEIKSKTNLENSQVGDERDPLFEKCCALV